MFSLFNLKEEKLNAGFFFSHQTFFLHLSFVELEHNQMIHFLSAPLHKHPQQYCAKADLWRTENKLYKIVLIRIYTGISALSTIQHLEFLRFAHSSYTC